MIVRRGYISSGTRRRRVRASVDEPRAPDSAAEGGDDLKRVTHMLTTGVLSLMARDNRSHIVSPCMCRFYC